MEAPTVTEIRQESNVPFVELGYPEPEGENPDRLQGKLDEAISDFRMATGLKLSDIDNDPDVDVRGPAIKKAIRMFVEYAVGSSQPTVLETAYDFDMVQSMSVSGYNETRRPIAANLAILHPWPALNSLLRSIMDSGPDGGTGGVIGSGESPAMKVQDLHPRPGTDVIRDGQNMSHTQSGFPYGW